ncbi:BadF/BadG/BcrA/BcrD ATPase family protein [Oharaeibacter diazotrophicus]|uniref:Glucosamine kinase n=2 Tax=Oharaeibacter diazotrophicus TaxID=1920512 RepID=A0A4R6RDD5_9HYPH|nr:BadF/BadG/BcrA/BcrD ATPase family protein [Oharaeibacter diazotrophicus]TDP84261.1 glucosamine kinase [Oharaeibacter diazotrophicus]BBE73298.1 glucosamine kinase GspK [Pleomorphomonas sp. SM30]GLS75089.1 N-acetylglucosamine kinase [Oharaeibacter diazotrophicus]
MSARLLLGVDGGGSGCRARLADADGRVLGEGRAGPANLTTDYDAALAAVDAAWRGAVAAAGLAPDAAAPRIIAVLGLAGAVALGDGARVAARGLPFARANICSDGEIACVGAHAGEFGGLVVVGTGSQAVLVEAAGVRRFGGWGFALSDDGSGAVVGREAARRAIAALEGLGPASALTRAIAARFGDSPLAMLDFALAARPADYARLAPDVFEHAGRGDPVALAIREAAVAAVTRLVDRLAAAGATRVALAGGLAASYAPLLSARLDGLVRPALGDALDGALTLAAAGP